jgi:hypothetical protein
VTDEPIPEVTVGTGRSQVKLRGIEAINAAGWTVKLILIAKAAAIVMISVGALYMFWKAPGSLSNLLLLAKWAG